MASKKKLERKTFTMLCRAMQGTLELLRDPVKLRINGKFEGQP